VSTRFWKRWNVLGLERFPHLDVGDAYGEWNLTTWSHSHSYPTACECAIAIQNKTILIQRQPDCVAHRHNAKSIGPLRKWTASRVAANCMPLPFLFYV